MTLLRLEFRHDSMAALLSKLSCSRITKPWGLCTIMNVCGYKLLNFGGIYYAMIDNEYRYPRSLTFTDFFSN